MSDEGREAHGYFKLRALLGRLEIAGKSSELRLALVPPQEASDSIRPRWHAPLARQPRKGVSLASGSVTRVRLRAQGAA